VQQPDRAKGIETLNIRYASQKYNVSDRKGYLQLFVFLQLCAGSLTKEQMVLNLPAFIDMHIIKQQRWHTRTHTRTRARTFTHTHTHTRTHMLP
jgi:ABC-type microcin C transport system permease subunit YejE